MNADRWSRIRRLHAEASELPSAERRAFLETECAGDQILFAEVWELVEADSDDDFLEAPEVEHVAPGVILGDFELLEELGSGGTGIVFRARQKSLEREVAIKIMPRHFALNERRVARFVREAKAAAKLKHPGIAPIFEVGLVGDNHFFAMELVAGHDLARELELQAEGRGLCASKDSSVQFREAARIVMQVAEALDFAHRAGVVHRDIKPNNIILDPEGRPRLVDFGLAKDESLGSITVTDKVEGTPYYMSPEQARLVEEQVDARTDIYSLGVVLYELLTRSRPFDGRTSQEVISKIIRREPKPVRSVVPGIPRDLAVICTKAMEKRPGERYATARALRDDLTSFLAGEPIRARPPGLMRKVSRFVTHHRVAASFLLAAVLTVGGISWANGYRERLTWPELHVDVLFADARVDAGAVEVNVTATPIHVFSGEAVGAPRELTPSSFRLPPGAWRIDVSAGEYGSSVLIRNIELGQSVMPLRARIVREEELAIASVRLEAYELPRWGVGAVNLEPPKPGGRNFLGSEGTLAIPSFLVQTEEMSFGLFRRYLKESGDPEPEAWSSYEVDRAGDDLPVVLVTRREARACAEWFGMRLPFEVELEYASRGPQWSRTPVWGEDLSSVDLANTQKFEDAKSGGVYAPFGTYLMNVEPTDTRPEAATPTGLLHVLGNVEEMTESQAPDPRPEGMGFTLANYVSYGGSFSVARFHPLLPFISSTPDRLHLAAAFRGFRCVK